MAAFEKAFRDGTAYRYAWIAFSNAFVILLGNVNKASSLLWQHVRLVVGIFTMTHASLPPASLAVLLHELIDGGEEMEALQWDCPREGSNYSSGPT